MNTINCHELPENWVWTILGEVAEIFMGSSPPSSSYNKEGNGLPFFQGKTDFGPLSPTPRTWCSSPYKVAEKGDVLISVRAPVGPTNLSSERSCIGRGLGAIRPRVGIPSLFVLFYLRSIQNDISHMGTGSTFTAIKRSNLETLPFPLAPLNEQRRIVAKVEALFAESKTAQEALVKVLVILRKFRSSMLERAFRGELTQRETDSKSAKHLLTEMSSDWQTELNENKLITNRGLPKLPNGWAWTKLGNLIESMKNGLYKPIKFYGKGTPCLRMYNIAEGKIVWKNMREMILSEEEKKAYSLRENDILLNRINSRELVGKAAVVPKGLGTVIFEAMTVRVRVKETLVDPRFVVYFLLTNYARSQIELECKQTVGMATVSQEDVKNWFIPYTSLKEQRHVVARIDEAFCLSDQVEVFIKKAEKQAERIDQAILAKATTGELVSQDPGDEAASVLLQRIKAGNV